MTRDLGGRLRFKNFFFLKCGQETGKKFRFMKNKVKKNTRKTLEVIRNKNKYLKFEKPSVVTNYDQVSL